MPDKKLTDSEIIKALECCCSKEIQFRNCPLPQNVKDGLDCGTVIAKECLDLINRQKAEIEDKERVIQFYAGVVENKNADIERLQKHIQEGIELAKQIPETVATVKAEAVKEFAERLKGQFRDCSRCEIGSHTYYMVGGLLLDNLVKEMVGDA